MQLDDHMKGFEKEEAFRQLFCHIRQYYPDLRFGLLRSAIATIAPTFNEKLHERKPCHRILRYVGCTWCPEGPQDDEFLKLGQTYVGTSFNGGTYTIKGYDDRPIGSAYFELVKEGM